MKLPGALSWLQNPKHEKTPPLSLEREILPSTVRTALAHNEAQLGPREIRELMVPERRMQRLGFYAAIKAADGNYDLQAQLLEKVSGKDFDLTQLTVDDIAGVLDDMEARKATVNGRKLAVISRNSGFTTWSSDLGKRLDDTTVPEDAPFFTVAYSSLIGIDALARKKGGHRPLHILNPNSFTTDSDHVGHVVHPNGEVKLLPRDFMRPDGAVVIDDIERSGDTRRAIQEFWGEGVNYVPLIRKSGDALDSRHDTEGDV